MRRYATATIAVLVSCSVSSSLGCASSYMPRPGPRIAVVMDSGSVAYVRDGKKYEGGLFGGDIEEAVRGNPQAEDYARQYKAGVEAGFLTTMVGVAGLVGGTVVTSVEASPSAGDRATPVAGLVTVGAGLVLYVTGLIVVLNATPHLYDAINAYNDGVPSPAAP
jgi:hypothetical protein